MRRLLVLAVLLGMFLGLRSLHAGGAGTTLLLAAIGFVVLASFTAAELGSGLKLPRVTGYIVAGVALGPSVANILSTDVVEQMTMFNTLALGLIAIGAGLELEVAALWRLRRTLGSTTLLKMLITGGLVFGAFVGIERWLHPLGLTADAHIFSVGLVLATLSLGTSPSITMAVISELRARGRVADLTLGAAVVKDLVLVVLLAVAISVARGWLGMRAAGDASVLAIIAKELGGSIGLGAVVGVLIIAYVRLVHAEMLLFVTALVLAVAEVSNALHLDLLLVFIAAGFVVRNFSTRAEDVLHPLETVALPVFVVFFTIAGARLDLQATWLILPVALALAVVRAGSFYVASDLGARIGKETPEVRERMWLAYLPQAGVTIGLLGLARQALPPIAKIIGDLEFAVVAINLLLGPIALRRALSGPSAGASSLPETPDSPPPVRENSAPKSPAASSLPPPRPISLGDAELERELIRLQTDLGRRGRELLRDEVRPRSDVLTRALVSVFETESLGTRRARLHAWVSQHAGAAIALRAGEAARLMVADFDQRLQRLPAEVLLPMEPEAYEVPDGASLGLRMRVLKARLRRGLARQPVMRRVPVRAAARIALMPRLSGVSVQLLGSWARTYAGVLEDLRRHAADELSQAATIDAVSERLRALEDRYRSDIDVALTQGIGELVELLSWADSPRMPSQSVRYSRVEPQTRGYLETLAKQPLVWVKVLARAEDALLLTTAIARVESGVGAALEKEVLLPLADAGEALGPGAAAARALLDRGVQALNAGDLERGTWSAFARDLAQARLARDGHGLAHGSFRAATAVHAAAAELRQLIETLPEALEVPLARTPVHRAAGPEDVALRQVALRAEARRELELDFLPIVDAESQRAAHAVQDFDVRIGDAVEMVRDSIDMVLEQGQTLDRAALEASFERAMAHLEHGATETRATLIGAHDAIQQALEAALVRLRSLGGAVARAPAVSEVGGLRARVAHLADIVQRRVRAFSHRVVAQSERWGLPELWQHRGRAGVSPHELRHAVQHLRSTGEAPTSYSRLFRLKPLRNRRLAVAHQDVLHGVLAAEREWLRGGPGTVLIVGDPGAGKTSLLNLCQVELSAPRVIRPEPVRPRREVGVVRALAYELGKGAQRKEVSAGLVAHRTVVLLDDLEQWFSPGVEGVRELRAFLDLVGKTRPQAAWIVTASSQFIEAWAEVVDVRAMFATVIHIPPLDAATLQRVVEARHGSSGLELVHRKPLRAVLGRMEREAHVSFRILGAVSGGNLSAALAAWPRCLRFEEGRARVLPELLLQHRLTLPEGVGVMARATLLLLLRHGPMSLLSIAEALEIAPIEAERQVVSLESTGLLVQTETALLALAPEVKGLLVSRLPGELD